MENSIELTAAAKQGANPVKKFLRMRETGLILIILALFVAMSFASPYFLTWVNMRAMVMAFAVEGIVVVGMTILLISGGIDLSVGSVTALAMVIAGSLFLAGVDPWLASLVAIAACTGQAGKDSPMKPGKGTEISKHDPNQIGRASCRERC